MDDCLKILYISHYFPPEVNAPARRVSEMAERWADNGAEVTVLTGFPNHPKGVIPVEYRGKIRQIEAFGKIKLIRTFVYAAANKGFLRRILNYLSFMVSAVLLGTGRVGRPDVLIATSPQFFVAVAGYVISRLKRCRFVFEVRDVWPEEIVAVGAIKNRFVIRALEAIEMFLYRKADLIVAVAAGTIDILTSRGVPRSKLVLIPNGVSIRQFDADSNGCNLRKGLGLEDKFVVTYLGTHGMAHRLGTVLEAADRLRQHDDIRFLFVGDGADKAGLMARARDMKLSNVVFHEQVAHDMVPKFYRISDLCLVPLRKAELFTRNIPSKIYEIMAARRPIIISTEGESRRLVERSGAGVGSRPEDPVDMADKIQRLYDDPELRRQMGSDGYSFVLANASRLKLADEYAAVLFRLLSGAPVCREETPSRESVAKDMICESDIRVPA